jgi:signal transduction histidine kinase
VAQREAGYIADTRDTSRSSFAQIAYVDPRGREIARVAAGRIVLPDPTPPSRNPLVRAARARGVAVGPAHAARGPGGRRILLAPMAVTEARPEHGVILAQLNLEFIGLSIGSFTNTGPRYTYYIVDGNGHLVARSDAPEDVSLRDLSGLTEVRDAVSRGPAPPPVDQEAVRGRDIEGRPVLATAAPLPRLGWSIIALQSDPGSQGPLTSALVRTGIALAAFLALAVLASYLLARRMTRPIRAIQAGAARIGEGSLDERIEVHTGDELESLADEFNLMAARLGDSYASLERRVEDRTRDLLGALRELERVSGEKTRFLANMSHELRTPLNAIINFADVLRDASAGPLTPRQARYLEDIHAAGRHLLVLITDILDLARIEAGRMDLEAQPVGLTACLEEGLSVVRERARAKGVSLSLEVDQDAEEIEADARKLRQVVFNLLANAVRFTPSGGAVAVTARRAPGQVEIAVADTGVGIAPADQERVFGEFEQAGPPGERQGGTGLGLALARRLVELHGGRILLESAPGRGSTFTVVLPQPPRPATPSLPAPPPMATGA